MKSRSRTSLLVFVALLLSGCNVNWTGLFLDPVITDPNPPVSPDSGKVSPAPVLVASNLRVLIVEETEDRMKLPSDQLAMFTSVILRKYLDANTVKLADGSPGYRIVDQDDVKSLPEPFKSAAAAKRGDKLPWVYVTNGKRGLSAPLPGNVDAFLGKCKAYEGSR